MIYINRPDLDKQSLYTTVLQTIEDISDEYALQKDFGTLSMANQEVVEFLMQTYDQFGVDFSCFIDNDEVGFCFESSEPLFKKLEEGQNGVLLSILSDDLEYQTDYKQISFSIHVKPKHIIQREPIRKEVVQQNKTI